MLNEQELSDLHDLFGNPVHVVTRADLLDSGDLIDVTEVAREAGFSVPVAITTGVWADCVAWDEADTQRQTCQDEAGRLWDVLWMAAGAARRGELSTLFNLHRVPRGGCGRRARLTTLRLEIAPGDQGEPVVTILLPEED